MKTRGTAWHIRGVFALMAFILCFAWGTNAVHAQEEGSSLSIAPTGQIIVKNATVVSVSGKNIVAETGWGAARLTWLVQTTGSTRFVPDVGSVEALKGMKPGHSVSFTGTLSGSLARPTVQASVVKNSEMLQDAVSVLGTVEGVDLASGTLVLGSQESATTVYVPAGALMSRDGGYTELADIKIGDSARVTGTLNAQTGVLSASRLTVQSFREAPAAQSPELGQGEGIFASLITWLKGSRGILSIRDR